MQTQQNYCTRNTKQLIVLLVDFPLWYKISPIERSYLFSSTRKFGKRLTIVKICRLTLCILHQRILCRSVQVLKIEVLGLPSYPAMDELSNEIITLFKVCERCVQLHSNWQIKICIGNSSNVNTSFTTLRLNYWWVKHTATRFENNLLTDNQVKCLPQ